MRLQKPILYFYFYFMNTEILNNVNWNNYKQFQIVIFFKHVIRNTTPFRHQREREPMQYASSISEYEGFTKEVIDNLEIYYIIDRYCLYIDIVYISCRPGHGDFCSIVLPHFRHIYELHLRRGH
jgi:hypothetical protein